MNFDFHYTLRTATDKLDRKHLEEMMLSQALNYPKYSNWVGRAISELEQKKKHAVMTLDNSSLVGAIVGQRHKEFPHVYELKWVRIMPEYEHRGFASEMIKLREFHLPEDITGLIIDTHEENLPMREFIEYAGYTQIGSANLYRPDDKEAIFFKQLPAKKETDLSKIKFALGI